MNTISTNQENQSKYKKVESNILQIVREKKVAPRAPHFSSRVIKQSPTQTSAPVPASKTAMSAPSVSAPSAQTDPLLTVKQNLQRLREIHERLKFVLQELEGLVE